MSNNGEEPEYLILPRDYEATLRAGQQTVLVASQLMQSRQLEDLQDEHKQVRSCSLRVLRGVFCDFTINPNGWNRSS